MLYIQKTNEERNNLDSEYLHFQCHQNRFSDISRITTHKPAHKLLPAILFFVLQISEIITHEI